MPNSQLAAKLYALSGQARAHLQAAGFVNWLRSRSELRLYEDSHGNFNSVGLAPPSRGSKRSSAEPAASDGAKRTRADSSSGGKSVTEYRAGPTDPIPPSKREGKRPVAIKPAKQSAPTDGLVAMELSALGETEISMYRRGLIEQKSGCRQEQGTRFSVRGTALQLRHAAELLLKGAKGTKSGAPELHVTANDSQADWVLGKDGSTLKQLWQKHASVKIRISRPDGSKSRVISLRGSISQIKEAVHDIAELWLGQGTAPPRRAQLSEGSAGGSSSSAAGQSSAAGASSGLSEVRVRSLEEIRAGKRVASAGSAPPSSGKARAITPKQPSAQPHPTPEPTPSPPVAAASAGPSAASPAVPPAAPPVLPPAQPPAAVSASASAAVYALDLNSDDDEDEEMVQPSLPVAASPETRSRTQSPERPQSPERSGEQAEAEAKAEKLVWEQAEAEARHRQEMQRLTEQLRRERQLKEQAPLSEEKRIEVDEVIWDAIDDKREKAGWTSAKIKAEKNHLKLKVRRKPVVCAFTLNDVGKSLSIAGGVVKVNTVERALLWTGQVPEDVSGAKILCVEERIGGRLEVRGAEMLRENPVTGLVVQVLAHMGKIQGQAGMWKKTQVIFEGEVGEDDGGLTEEMHAAFWKGVTSTELGLFECADQLHSRDQPVFLPKPGACTHSLKMVGLMLCRSVIKDKPTGPGLSRIVLDFLLEAEGKPLRAFAATSKPIVEQAERAIESLMQFDVLDAATYSRYLSDESGELRDSDWIATRWLGDDSLPLGEIVKLHEQHELFNELPTVDNLPHAIVESCRWILCESRRVELEALRDGFTCHVNSNN